MFGVFAVAGPAQAYVGPGAGISLLSALWVLLAVIGSAILYVVLWPLRRWRKRRKHKRSENEAAQKPKAAKQDEQTSGKSENDNQG